MKLVFLSSLCVIFLISCTSPAATNTAQPTVPRATATITPVPTPTFTPAPLGQRTSFDRTDDYEGLYQVHILYVTLSDSIDMNRDLDGKIDKSVADANAWFSEQTGGSTIRFDTFEGALDITYVQLNLTNAEFIAETVSTFGDKLFIRDMLEATLNDLGVFQPGKIYVAFFEIAEQAYTCADGANPPDLPGRLAGLYPSAILDDGRDCANEPLGAGITYTDMGIIHEIVHVLGFASSCGHNPTSHDNMSHTGDDNRDLMWAPSESDTRYWDTDNMLLDPGNDDYYNIADENCTDLADSAFIEPLPTISYFPPSWKAAWEYQN